MPMLFTDRPRHPPGTRKYLARTKKGERAVNPEVLLGAVIGASACLFAATVIFDAYEKAIEQRTLAEVVVQKFRQDVERERFRIGVQREPEAAEGRPAHAIAPQQW
jgi:hypothetical protein